MKTNIETVWLRSTAGERQDFIELYADDIREMLPRYNDHDEPETEELIGHERSDDCDDEQLDPVELPAVLDTNGSDDDDGDFPATNDEEFPAASRGNRRRAARKRVPASPSSKDEVERLTHEFLERGGQVTKVRRGFSGLQPPPKRIPAWRKIASKGV